MIGAQDPLKILATEKKTETNTINKIGEVYICGDV